MIKKDDRLFPVLHEDDGQGRIEDHVLLVVLVMREVARNGEVPDGRERRRQEGERRRRQYCADHVELAPSRRQLIYSPRSRLSDATTEGSRARATRSAAIWVPSSVQCPSVSR